MWSTMQLSSNTIFVSRGRRHKTCGITTFVTKSWLQSKVIFEWMVKRDNISSERRGKEKESLVKCGLILGIGGTILEMCFGVSQDMESEPWEWDIEGQRLRLEYDLCGLTVLCQDGRLCLVPSFVHRDRFPFFILRWKTASKKHPWFEVKFFRLSGSLYSG